MRELKFNDGRFKIMQIADAQERLPVNPDTLHLIDLAVRKENPDLIVFTGDQIAGYYPCFKSNTEQVIDGIVKKLTATADELGIPYCITFGNHDSDSGMSNREQTEKIYSKLPGYVCGEYRNEDDTGTYSLQIKSTDGTKNIFNLYLIDSNKKGSNGTYMPVTKEQVKWYKEEREKIKELNGEYLPSFIFQHIPLPEFFDVLTPSKRFAKGAVEAFDDHKNEYYVLSDEMKARGDFMYESPATPVENTGEFEAFKEKGEVLGVFVGHDHNNSFTAELDGIMLAYCQCCGFNTYGPGGDRGVRILELYENNITNFETRTVTMNSLCDYRPSKPALEFVLSNMPSSVKEVKHTLKDVALIGGAVTLVSAVFKIMRRK